MIKTVNDHQHESFIEKDFSETQEIINNKTETSSMLCSPVISATSSPTHEFSFTLSSSIQSVAETATTSPTIFAKKHQNQQQQQQQQPPLAIDLSPADDIFFHGHLLPLHFLSHLHSSSPRSSTTSLDSFTLPVVKETSQEGKPSNNLNDQDKNSRTTQSNPDSFSTKESHSSKPKPFSLFAKWRKGSDQSKEKQENKKKLLKFDVSEFVKRYVKMVKPLLSPKGGGRRDGYGVPRQSYSFSGSLTPRVNKREGFRGSRGEFSAPASMITSPTNSGRILTAPTGVPSPVSDSTMEELQSAIQAAIAHCKKSVSAQGKKPQEILPVPVN